MASVSKREPGSVDAGRRTRKKTRTPLGPERPIAPSPEEVGVRVLGDQVEERLEGGHLGRGVARLAGLITLRRGRWHATKALRTTFARTGAAGVYAVLFRAFVAKYAWNSADRYPELDIVQASWAYSLLQLLRHGTTWRAGAFYADRFARAFPTAVDEAEAYGAALPWYGDPEAALARVYEVRVLERFAVVLGLAEVELGRTLEDYGRVLRVRATPALAEVVAERVG